MRKDSQFFKYILKIVPIDFVCETNVDVIKEIVTQGVEKNINSTESFRIKLNRRNNDLIDRDRFIRKMARGIKNDVDLENPDKIIRFEVLGNMTGISFLQKDDVLRIRSDKWAQ